MHREFKITKNEKDYLRELAARQLEYANLPVMEEREKLWYAHNRLEGERPVIVMEYQTFESEILPQPRCVSPAAAEIEKTLLGQLVNHELINDDKVVPPYYAINWDIAIKEFDMDIETSHAVDGNGRNIGYVWQHPIHDLKEDFHLLKHSVYKSDKEGTMAWKSFIEETLGDILPVVVKNNSLAWNAVITSKVIRLMGLEKMMYSMMDYPDEMHALNSFLVDDILAFARWQQEEGLLVLNNGNDYTGAGSYGFTTELPGEDYIENGQVSLKDLWLNINSQESVGISPEMYGEFIYPYYKRLAEEYGLVYYGCCEPVQGIWEEYLSKLPNLRKVSISPWCDEEFMGRALKNSPVIYSRKPSPNYIGVGSFEEDNFTKYMAKTLEAAKGGHLEIIFRDVYTLDGDKSKPGKAVKIVRGLIEKMW